MPRMTAERPRENLPVLSVDNLEKAYDAIWDTLIAYGEVRYQMGIRDAAPHENAPEPRIDGMDLAKRANELSPLIREMFLAFLTVLAKRSGTTE